MHKFLGAVLATTAMALSFPAYAEDRPAFRVPLDSLGATPSVDPVWSWQEEVSACSNTCGTGTRTTTYTCQDVSQIDFSTGGFGSAEPSSMCVMEVGAQPADSSEVCTNFSGCEYDWVRPPVTTTVHRGRVGCGDVERVYDPRCERADGTVLATEDHGFCRNDLPDYNDVADGVDGALGYDRRGIETAQCNTSDHEWRTSAWSAPSSTCSDAAVSTRSVVCYRKFDNSVQPDSACASPKPDSTKVEGVYSSCTYSATFGGWGSWSSGCSSSATRNRTVTCTRSDGKTVDPSICQANGVNVSPLTQTQARYGSCSYARVNPSAWSAWSSTCSASAKRTRTYDCRRSDGTIVPDGQCESRGIDLDEEQTQAVYSGCTYSWDTGAWSGWSSSCSSTATRTRSVTCERSNGTTVADSYCSGSKPAAAEVSGQYASCSYSAANWSSWSAWSSTCASNATRTRTAQCRRSDGTIVSSNECTSRGISLSQTDTQAVYSGCSYSWDVGAWSGWSSSCSSSATRTRSVACERSNGTTVADSYCSGSKPATTEVSGQYASCSYSAANWSSWSAWSSTCASNATRTRTAQCRRSDGTIVSSNECTSRGISLSQTDTQAVYSGCTYSTSYGSWSACKSGSQTRSITCMRSDGVQVQSSNCGFSGSPTTQSQSCTSTVTLWLVYQNTATVPCGGSPTGGSSITLTARKNLDRQASYQEVYNAAPSITRCIVERSSINPRRGDGVYTFTGYTGNPVPVVYPMSTPQQITVNQ